ncbi:MAG TPA: hypothetical protein DCG14_09840, partial [Phycisphaerales bacterium]|nr:hypothetical protein [Phycisphaerales bacterium]
MRFERRAAIGPHALAREVESRAGAAGIRRKIEGEKTARDGLLMEAVTSVDLAQSVVLKEETPAVRTL